jgi:hypothetical protein
MFQPRRCGPALFGLLLISLSFAAAPPDKGTPNRSALAQARYRAALKQFDEIWLYYQQSRVESFDVYVWSRLVLDSQQAVSDKQADRVAAFEDHMNRMQKLEALIKKIRRLGFGRSIDVGASEYYRREAEYWFEEARSR